MGYFTNLAAPLATATLLSLSAGAAADEVTYFGDFEDAFGGVGGYSSEDPPVPGSFFLEVNEGVVGIPKFDPSLGTLTDITVFVDDSAPIFYTLGGDVSADELDDGVPDGFGAMVSLETDVGLYYEATGGSGFESVVADVVELSGLCTGGAGDSGCIDELFAFADGELVGGASLFSTALLTDFVGLGDVASLYVQLYVPVTADFEVENATGFADLSYDISDLDSGADDEVIGVTYTYTPVPEPATLTFLLPAAACLRSRRARRT